MLRQLFFVGLMFICIPGIPQFNRIYTAQLDHSWLNCDSHRNLYAVSENRFLKYSPPYDSSIFYSLLDEEKPSLIDLSNPNRIALFYQSTRKVILLDSNLNELLRPFYLDELGMYEISLISASNDNGLWFYNYQNNSLSKLNSNFLLAVRFVNLNSYFQAPSFPNFIMSLDEKLYINVPSTGILVIGQNGTYQNAIQLRGLIDFQIENNILFFYRDHIIYCFDTKSLKTKKIYTPNEPDILNAWFFKNQIILQKKDGFSVYSHEISPVDNN